MDDARNDLLDLLCILLNSNSSDGRSGYLPRMLPCMPIVRSWLTLLGRKAMVGVLPLIGASFSWLSLLSRTPRNSTNSRPNIGDRIASKAGMA